MLKLITEAQEKERRKPFHIISRPMFSEAQIEVNKIAQQKRLDGKRSFEQSKTTYLTRAGTNELGNN